MRIAIDASRCTVPNPTGTERYALELIRAIIRRNSQHNLILYFRDQPAADLFPSSNSVIQRVIPFRRAWTHIRFAAALWAERPDVTFVPAHTLPVGFPGRAVVTIHDLGYRYFPQAHPARQRQYLDLTTRYSAARASVILADSQATAHDLTQFYGTSAEKIRVLYPGVTPLPSGDVSVIRQRYHLPEQYWLFIGTLQPRKNIARLVEAFRQWQQAHPNDSTGLVLAGGQGWLYDPTWAEGVAGVTITGYIEEADKGTLYAGARALVFPSLYEGFGFPVIEAMHAGTPVIASNTSSLPELVGEAGLLVDPLEVGAIAGAMARLSDDPSLADRLRSAGREQAAHFTWEQAADNALTALEHAAR